MTRWSFGKKALVAAVLVLLCVLLAVLDQCTGGFP